MPILLASLILAGAVLQAGQPSSPAAPAVCRQSRTPRALTLDFGDGFAVTGAGSRQIGDRTQWAWTGEHCSAWIKASAHADVDAAGRTLSLPPGEDFEAHGEDPSGTRHMVVTASGREFRRGDRVVLPTVADDQWFSAMVLEFTRRSGRRAAERSTAILRGGGVKALLDEAEEIAGARIRAQYLMAAVSAVRGPDRAGFIKDASRLLDHGIAWRNLLETIPADWRRDDAVIAVVFAESCAVDGDEVVEWILRSFPTPKPLPPALRSAAESLINTLHSADRRAAWRETLSR